MGHHRPALWVLLLSAGGCLAAALRPGILLAQSVDYGALEQVFGEPVTTSATGKPQRASDVPADMDIITAEQIRRSGYDNLPDILRLVPGVDVRRYGFAAADVSIRGYNRPFNPRLLVLINGQQAYLDDYGRTRWYALPVELDEIRQIEVIKGPSSALYGFNAASGVINIVTWDPLRDKQNAVTARGGTQGYGALSAVGTAQVADRGGVRVSAGGFRARDFAPAGLSPSNQALRQSPERGSVAADGRVRVAPGVELALNASAVNLRAAEEPSSPYYSTGFYRLNAVRAAVTADTGLGLLALSFYRNETRYSVAGAFGSGDSHDRLYVAQASDTVKLGASHTVRLGLEYRNSAASSSSNFAGRIGDQVASASLMWDWQVTPTLALTNAVRVDRFALSQSGALPPGAGPTAADYKGRGLTEPSFNSGLVWHATERDTLRLTAARGLQLPSLFDFGFRLSGVRAVGDASVPYSFVGSPNLAASAVSNVELGYERTLSDLHSTVRVALFAQRTDNVITDPFGVIPVFNGRAVLSAAANTGHSSALGGELGVRGQAPLGAESSLRWDASYAYISVSDRLAVATEALQDFQHGTPTHVVTLGGGYTRGRAELDVHGRWQSRYRDYRGDPATLSVSPIEVGNYVQFDARLGYRVTDHITLALTAEQFNVSRLLQSAGPPVERRVFLSTTLRF